MSSNQWLGDKTHIAAEFAGGVMVTVEHDRVMLAPGARVGVAFDASDLHLFDAEGGWALAHGGRLA